jgi:hypothetical protein
MDRSQVIRNSKLLALGLAVASILIIGFVCTLPVGTNLQDQYRNPVINITQSDYKQALAQWNKSNIRNYDILVGSSKTVWDYTECVYWVRETAIYEACENDENRPLPSTYPRVPEEQYAYTFTIPTLFKRASDDLAASKTPFLPTDDHAQHIYGISFDPVLGYPTAIRESYTNNPGAHSDSKVLVKQFRVVAPDAPHLLFETYWRPVTPTPFIPPFGP